MLFGGFPIKQLKDFFIFSKNLIADHLGISDIRLFRKSMLSPFRTNAGRNSFIEHDLASNVFKADFSGRIGKEDTSVKGDSIRVVLLMKYDL